MIATIAAIAEKKAQRLQRSYGNHSPASATTIAVRETSVLSHRSAIVAILVRYTAFTETKFSVIISSIFTEETL